MAAIHATAIMLLRNNHYYNHNPITIFRHRFSDHDPLSAAPRRAAPAAAVRERADAEAQLGL